MTYVIKHTDEEKFVRARKVLAFWTSRHDATTYLTEADAQIAIKQLGIPYVTAVPLDQSRDNWTVTVFWKDDAILKMNFKTLGGAKQFLTEIVEGPRLFNSVTIAQI